MAIWSLPLCTHVHLLICGGALELRDRSCTIEGRMGPPKKYIFHLGSGDFVRKKLGTEFKIMI
jgi:hypothetical protein